MKVCFITGEYPPMQGGVADYTRMLAAALHGRGVEVSVLTSARAHSGQGSVTESSPSFGGSESDPWPVYPVVDRWNFRSWRHILNHLHATRPDILHIQYQTSAFAMHPAINLLPLWLKRQPGRPGIVTTFHDLGVPYLFPKAGRMRHKVTLALIRGSDHTVVTNVEDWREACALSHAGPPGRKGPGDAPSTTIHVVPIGSNIPANPPDGYDRSRWRTQLGVSSDQPLLSYFGLLNQSKGMETLLEVLRALVDGGTELKLLMIGAEAGDSDPTNIVYRRKILRYIADLGLDGRIIWTGYSTPRDVSGHLLSSDICVLPFRDGASFRRGSLHAALAHGLPVVSTRGRNAGHESPATGSMDQIVDGRHAVLVDPNDTEGLRRAIEQLIHQPEMRARLGQQGRILAQAFSWPNIAQRTQAIYEEILRQ